MEICQHRFVEVVILLTIIFAFVNGMINVETFDSETAEHNITDTDTVIDLGLIFSPQILGHPIHVCHFVRATISPC
jgi:hypothetical protein